MHVILSEVPLFLRIMFSLTSIIVRSWIRRMESASIDYGTRQYDVAIGRWHAIVQKCEKYNYLSLYVYVFIFTPFGHKKEGAKK